MKKVYDNSYFVFSFCRNFFLVILLCALGSSGEIFAQANFSINGFPGNSPATVCLGTTYQFAKTAPAGGAVTWNFGTGTPSSGNTNPINVTFNTRGTTTITLTVDPLDGNPPQVKTITLNIFDVLTTPVVTDVTCNLGSNGSTTLDVTGSGNYSFSWSDIGPVPSATRNNMTAGSYTVTVTDLQSIPSNCQRVIPVTVSQPPAISLLNFTIQDVLCFGDATGSISLTPTGGVGGFSYSWVNLTDLNQILPPNSSQNNLKAGLYSATITDAAGCVFLQQITISQPTKLKSFVNPRDIDSVSCRGLSDGSIIASPSGGTGGGTYTYDLISGNGTETHLSPDSTFSNLPAGFYTVRITDQNLCVDETMVQIFEPEVLTIFLEGKRNVSCNGFSDGNIGINVTGGNPDYTYQWSTPDGSDITSQRTQEDIGDLEAGTYTVTVTDRKNCPVLTQSFTITQPDPLVITLIDLQSVSCATSNDGFINITVSGGTPPYSFSWDRDQLINFANTEDIVNAVAGDYVVKVTDFNGCVQTLNITLDKPQILRFNDIQKTNPKCFGSNDGSIRVDVVGGVVAGDYTYNWSPKPSNIEENTFLEAGTYFVTVTDDAGCQIDTFIVLTEPTEITITLVKITDTDCSGDQNGSIDIDVQGGTPEYSYSWSGPSIIGNNQDVQNALPGTYSVVVSDFSECLATASFTIGGSSPLSVALVKTDVNCNGQNNASIDITPSGGTPFPGSKPFYLYNWTKDGGFFGQTQDLSKLVAGDYCVTITDSKNCRIDTCVSITQPTSIISNIKNSKNQSCFLTFDGFAVVEASGGTPPYTYKWSNGAITDSIFGLKAGVYSVTVKDSRGCQVDLPVSASITRPPQLTVALLQKTNVSCLAGTDGTISVITNGGTPTYKFVWSDPNTINSSVRTNLSAGTYSVTVTDTMSCTASLSITITAPTTGVVVALNSKVDNPCFGDQKAMVTVKVSGGVPPYSYVWSNASSNTVTASNLAAGQYCVTVTDAKGCSSAFCQVITQPDLLTVTTSSITNASCNSGNTGIIRVDINGGTQPYRYLWNYQSRKTQDLANVPPGSYSLTVTDSKNCKATLDAIITGPNQLIMVVDSFKNPSCGASPDGAVFTTISGGTQPYQFKWSNGKTTQNISQLVAGKYTVTYTDANGCSDTLSVTLVSPQTLAISSSIVSNSLCNGANNGEINLVVVGGTLPLDFSWAPDPNGDFNGKENITGLSPQCYTVIVTDVNGCAISQTFCITEPDLLTASITTNKGPSCNGADDSELTVTPVGGTPPYKYLWDTGDPRDTTNTLSGRTGGSYSVQITDKNNCTVSVEEVILLEPDQLRLELNFIDLIRCDNPNGGNVGFQALGGTFPYSYLWSTGSTDEEINNLSPGQYCLTVTDMNGCTVDTCVVFDPAVQPTIELGTIVKPGCDGSNSGLISVSGVGGTEPYTFLWTNGDFGNTITDLAPGEYCVFITDANACISDPTCITLEREPDPIPVFIPPSSPICPSTTPFVLKATPIGGIFSGNGIENDSIFNPAVAGVGTHNITYSGDVFGCPYTITKSIKVNPTPDSVKILIAGSDTLSRLCGDVNSPYNIQFTPQKPGVQAIFIGPGVRQVGHNQYQFVPKVAGVGTHTIVGIFTNSSTFCSLSQTRVITVDPPILVDLQVDKSTLCRGESAILTATGGTTYTWSPTTGLNCGTCKNVGGTVIATPSQTTTYTVTGKTGSCPDQKTVRIEVLQQKPISITASKTIVCEGDPVILRASSTETEYTYAWSQRGTFPGATGPSITVNPFLTDTFTVVGTLPNGCFRTAQIVLVVRPIRLILEADNPFICKGQSTEINATSTEPGIFTFTWAPATGLNTTRGDKVIASPKRTTTYTVVRSGTGSCRIATITITVVDGQATFAPETPKEACFSELPFALNATPPGGVFSGKGIANLGGGIFIFDPATAGKGEHTITYEALLQGTCVVTATTKIKVIDERSPKLVGFRNEYCRLQPTIILNFDSKGAIVSSPENDARPLADQFLTANTFDPLKAGLGTFTIVVGMPIGSFCYKDTTYTVNVVEPNVDIIGLDPVYCYSQQPVTLTGIPTGGVFRGRGIQNGNVFNPKRAGVGVSTVIYSGKDGKCTYSKTVAVRVYPDLRATASSTPVTDPLLPNGTISFNIQGGLGQFEMSLDGGDSFIPFENKLVGLDAGIYDIVIRNVGGTCPVTLSVEVKSTVQICDRPTGVTISNITDNTADISWTASPTAISYEFEYRKLTDVEFTLLQTDLTSITLTNLFCNSDYEIRIRSICEGSIKSPNTTLQSFITTGETCPNTCMPPTDIVSENVTVNSLDLTWIPVDGAIGYLIEYQEVGGSGFITKTVNSNRVSLTDLNPKTKYAYFIRTICAGRDSSEFIGDTTQSDSPCKPPVTFTISEETQNSAKISWIDTPGALQYIVEYREIGQIIPFTEQTVTTNFIIITGLTSGFEYEYRVRSVCGSFGESETSEIDSFTTLGQLECKAPTGLRIVNITRNSAMAVWAPIEGSTAYEVYYREVGTFLWQLIRTINNVVVLTGLEENKTYEWSVRTECGANIFSDEVLGPKFTTTTGSPTCNPPTNVSVSKITGNSATISWNAALNAANYEVSYNIVGSPDIKTVTTTSTSIVITNLKPGKNYEFVVRTRCKDGNSSVNVPGATFKTLGVEGCPNPINIKVENLTNRSVLLKWDATAEALSYEVEYKGVNDLFSQVLDVNTNQLSLSNLIPNTEYQFVVRSKCDANKVSADGVGPNFKTLPEEGACTAPVNVRAETITSTTLLITWNTVPGALSYQIDFKSQGELVFKHTTSSSNSVLLTELIPNSNYEIIVKAVCTGDILSPDSKIITVKTTDGNTCSTPNLVEVISTTSATAEIVWQPVTGALRYEIEYKLIGESATQTVTSQEARVVLANLPGNRQFQFVVRAVCGTDVKSQNSPVGNFSTTVSGTCAAPRNVTLSNITDESVFITWSLVPGATRYEVDYRLFGELSWITMGANTNAYTLRGLADGTKYEVIVRSICPGNQTSTDNFINRFTTILEGGCERPTNFKASEITFDGVKFIWDAIPGAIGYEIEYRIKGSTSFTKVSINSNTLTLGNLNSNTSYEAIVRTICSDNLKSFETDIIEFKTKESVSCGLAGFNRVQATESTISMSWSPVMGATGYEIYYRQDPNGNFMLRRMGVNQLTLTLASLPANTQYTIKIRTLCVNGSSDFSPNTVIVTSPQSIPCSTPVINSITTTKTVATVRWNVVPNATGYTINYRRKSGGGSLTFNINSGNINSTNLTNLTPNAEFEVRILARCGISSSQYSGYNTFKTLAGKDGSVISVAEHLEIYPNPTNDLVYLSFNTDHITDEKLKVKIFDVTGANVFDSEYVITEGNNKFVLDLSKYSSGIYFVRTQIDGRFETTKLIKN